MLYLTFQKSKIDFATVQSAVEVCLLSFTKIKQVHGSNLTAFLVQVATDATEGFTLQHIFVSD